jgi:hypothetical protein
VSESTPCCYTWRHGVELFLPIERVLWVASLLAEVLVVLRLLHERLLRRFPLFSLFLAAEVICSIVLMQTDIKSRSYAEAFRICTLIMTIFRLGVAAELYERICAHFPGIGGFRVAMAGVFVLMAGLITAFTFRPHLVNQWAFPQTIVVVVQRFQSEILAGVFLLTWIFLHSILSIRQPFRPNVLNHWRLTTIYFGVSGAIGLLIQLSGGGVAVFPINSGLLAIHLACFLAWFHVMRRAGEKLPLFVRLLPDQVAAVERYNRTLLETVTSLPAEILARQAENQDTPLRRARSH